MSVRELHGECLGLGDSDAKSRLEATRAVPLGASFPGDGMTSRASKREASLSPADVGVIMRGAAFRDEAQAILVDGVVRLTFRMCPSTYGCNAPSCGFSRSPILPAVHGWTAKDYPLAAFRYKTISK